MFNILCDPWLSVLSSKGTTSRLSLIEALQTAQDIHIAYPNPMDRLGAFRFILAVLLWCREQTNVELSDEIPAKWIAFLYENQHLFNLFGDGERFYQVSNLNRLRPITELFHEIPTGNNAWHFRHVRDYGSGVCCSCCVTGILRLPIFTVSGLPDLKSGINGSPPIYALVWAANLLSAIKHNWQPPENMGKPIWVSPYCYKQDQEVPLLAGLTVPARRLFLEEPIDSDEPCVVCGSKAGKLITYCRFESAGLLENSTWNDPHTFIKDDRLIKPENIMITGKLVRDMRYREVLAQMLKRYHLSTPQKVLIIGFATKEAKFVDIWEKTLIIDPKHITDEKIGVVSQWNEFVYKSALYPKNSKAGHNIINKSLYNDLISHIETKLYPKLTRLISSENPTWQEATETYAPSFKIASETLYSKPHDIHRKRKFSRSIPVVKLDTTSKENDNNV